MIKYVLIKQIEHMQNAEEKYVSAMFLFQNTNNAHCFKF